MDLRADVALAEMGICDQKPSKEFVGLGDVRLVAPGEPRRSLLSLRLHRQDLRMPPVGERDRFGAALIDRWIRQLKTCAP